MHASCTPSLVTGVRSVFIIVLFLFIKNCYYFPAHMLFPNRIRFSDGFTTIRTETPGSPALHLFKMSIIKRNFCFRKGSK